MDAVAAALASPPPEDDRGERDRGGFRGRGGRGPRDRNGRR
jgi:hypothetical protein